MAGVRRIGALPPDPRCLVDKERFMRSMEGGKTEGHRLGLRRDKLNSNGVSDEIGRRFRSELTHHFVFVRFDSSG